MSTLRINNIEAQSVPASPTIDEKVKVTNSSGDILVNIDGKTSGITTIGINTTDGNIKFDANSNVLITGILTATTLAGNFTPDSLEIGSNIKLGNAGVITATSFVGSGANLTGIDATKIITGNTQVQTIDTGSDGHIKFTTEGSERARILANGNIGIGEDAPVAKVHIAGSNYVSVGGGGFDSNVVLAITRNFTVGQSAGLALNSGTSATSFIHLGDADDPDIGKITYDHSNNSMSFTSNTNERIRITSGGNVNIGGEFTQTSRTFAVAGSALFKAGEADIWLHSTGANGVWRILGSTGGSTHQFRIYDNTGAADRLIIDSNGRVVIGATNTTNASTNADDLVVSGSGNRGITIVSTNSNYSNLFFSDGSSGAAPYIGYVQYNHGNNHLNLGANGGQRVQLYDKDGGTNHSVLQVGGSSGNNHYNAISNATITFGGGDDIENYFLGVRRENYGGDYTKLDLRWHTGIRMGAQQIYGGIRFFNDEDLDSLKFSIMGGGDHVEAHTTFRPGANNTYNCGTSGRRWAQIWYYNANTTSDRNEKNTITESDLGLDFICKLKPVSYKWNQREGENADTKTHYGLISQDVEETVIESGKTLDDFGAIVKPEGDDPMGLSYEEFISPLVKAIQEQQEQIKILQEKIASLEGS